MVTARPIRSRFVLLLIVVFTNLGLIGFFYHSQRSRNLAPWRLDAAAQVDRTKVAILNGNGAHDEVVVSFLYGLRQIQNLDVALYWDDPRYGIESIVSNYYEKLIKPMMVFVQDSAYYGDPDMVVMTSCDTYDLHRASPHLLEMANRNPNFRVMCVMHNPHATEHVDALLSALAEKSALHMVGLSSHVVDYVTGDMLPRLARDVNPIFANVSTTLFVPTFPYNVPHKCGSSETTDDKECRTSFVVQGLFESFRRDYSSLFEHLQSKLQHNETDWKDFQLQLLGQGSPFELQEPLSKHVTTRNNLPYLEYYYAIHHNVALLPAFGSDAYYEYKASSSVGAALLTGTPLVANKRLLDTYRHLSVDGVYHQEANESVIDTVDRIRKLHPAVMNEKRANASRMNERIILDNIRIWSEFVILHASEA
ncbi:hypothetical protein BZG36_04586 [Bifiguratus adelaidae]|uniref:Glycosyl transferase family 1 domain-containing protein n=1 Tax=Bifiguratus adelaidae TaxID=1938954 RepID=A0A261XUU7_9FUNG|nr:hypothetical protein BZG36_04586 [Bifiguratus adelaidae]